MNAQDRTFYQLLLNGRLGSNAVLADHNYLFQFGMNFENGSGGKGSRRLVM
jgi:hypothetical protein